MQTKLYVSLLFVISLSSCVSVSKLKENTAFLEPQNINQSAERALEETFYTQGSWPEASWWKSFESEELNPLMEIALSANPSIQAIGQKVEIAKQEMIKARSKLFPFVGFEAKENWSHASKNGIYFALNPNIPQNLNLIQLNLGLNYEFDFWGKYRNLFKSSRCMAIAEVAQKQQVELVVTTAVAQAFFALKTFMLQRKLYSELYNVQNDSKELVRLLNKKAIQSKIAPIPFQVELDEIAKTLKTLDEQILQSSHLLNILLGRSPDTPLDICDELTGLPKAISLPQDLSSELLVRRPDLVAAIWRVKSLAYDANAAVADFFPRVNLMGLLGLESISYPQLMSWKSGTMGLIPSIALPIFKAGEIKSNLRIKKSQLNQSIYEYNDLLLKSLQEVADSLALTTSWYQKKEIQDNILQNEMLNLDLMGMRSKVGIDNLIQLNSAKEAYLLKQIQDVQITYNQFISVIYLIKSLGGGFMEEASLQ